MLVPRLGLCNSPSSPFSPLPPTPPVPEKPSGGRQRETQTSFGHTLQHLLASLSFWPLLGLLRPQLFFWDSCLSWGGGQEG